MSDAKRLLEAYREVSEVDDQPAPEVFERLQSEIEAEAVASPRRAASWLLVGIGVAASVAAVVAIGAWPSPTLQSVDGATPVSTAIDRVRDTPPTPAPSEPAPAPELEPATQPETAPAPQLEPAPSPRPPKTPATQPGRDDTLLQELALLRKARAAMQRGDLAAAGAALRAHSTSFARGQLAEERDALWVEVRCRRGSKNTGQAAFEAAHPSSHHLVAIRAACEKK